MGNEKQEAMLHLMEDAWVYVHLDPRRDGVKLPEFLRQERRLALQYGYNMPIPIWDLVVDDKGISATLSFRQTPHATFIPWPAVFAITDGEKRTKVWEEDIPADLNLSAEAEQPKAPEPEKKPETVGWAKTGKKPRPSHLKLVD